jgi:trans-aconitate methyltransferase
MDPSTRNLLYQRPELYELVYPEENEATPRMCLRMFSRYLAIQPSSILDIGCGTGRDLNVLSRYCNDCWGIDYLQENIDYAKKTRPHLILIHGDMRSIRLEREVLQLCSHPVIGWQDAPPGIFVLWLIQVAAI